MRSTSRRSRHWLSLLLLALLTPVVVFTACRPAEEGEATADDMEPYIETGDLPAIRERGYLRILMPPQREFVQERVEFPLEVDRQQAVDFAEEMGLTPVVEILPSELALLRALNKGEGDLVLARLRPTPELQEEQTFSAPLDYVREMVVTPATSRAEAAEDLRGLRVGVQQDSSYFDSLTNIQGEVPFDISTVPGDMPMEQLLDLVATGEYDATVADEDFLEIVLARRSDVKSAFPLTKDRPVAWAMRPGSEQFKTALDLFLQQSELTADLGETFKGDLDEIKERGVLRVLTRNNPVTYFLYRGEQMGFEFELARRFARALGVRMQVVVPREPGLLTHYLLEGRGDLIAASMKVTPERQRVLEFTRSYNQVSELLVTRAGESFDRMEGLAGKKLALQRSGTYYPSLVEIQRTRDFDIIEISEEMESDEIVSQVADGEYDVTVVDSNILNLELTYRDDVESAFPLGSPIPVAWAVRPGNRRLLAAADSFLSKQKGSEFFNVLQKKYFGNRDTVAQRLAERPRRPGELSPYDETFQRWGREREIDWRLITSQAYQESRFDPLARSWAGALGLMQIMPRTARELGVKRTADLRNPEIAVEAGTLYLKRLLNQWDRSIPFSERLRFALASYNAGRGHIIDARTLAREQGLDPNVWYDNVAKVAPLLAKRRIARNAKHGYCRCEEPVGYVRNIDERYLAYVQLLDMVYGPTGGDDSEGVEEDAEDDADGDAASAR